MKPKSSKGAFTLMEMITVMAIAALITIASAPSFVNFTRTQRIRGAAGDIASALNSARRYAITLNAEKAVYVYADDYSDDDLKNSFLFWETENNMERKLLHRTVEIYSVSGSVMPGGEYEFMFTSRGALSGSSGSVGLADTAGRIIPITIYNTTGRVKVGELQEP
jgi:prepilin-type N-terminal cleavage/methylation domain-containing protein